MVALSTGLRVKLLGVKVKKPEEALRYMKERVLGKEVSLSFDNGKPSDQNTVSAYVYLKNRIFINAYLVKSGLAEPDPSADYRLKEKFKKLSAERT